MAALLTGGAVALPLLAKIDFKKKTPELDEIFCRTGLKYTNEDDRSKYAAKLTQAGIDKPSEWFLVAANFGGRFYNRVFASGYFGIGSILDDIVCSSGLYRSGNMAEQCSKQEKE